MKKNIRYQELMIKKLQGQISPEEEVVLRSWIDESPANKRAFEEYESAWQRTALPDEENISAEESWTKLQKRMQEPGIVPAKNRFVTRISYAISAVAAIAVLLIAVYLRNDRQNEVCIRSGNSAKIKIELPDHSVVWLKTQSVLTYNKKKFSGKRVVHLDGTGFFEITKQHGNTFSVMTERTNITVLGTSFEVNSRRDPMIENISVITGKVLYSAEGKEANMVMLTPGYTARLDSGFRIQVVQENNINNIAWKTDSMNFSDTPLRDVASALAEYFNTKIVIKNPVLEKCRFTGSFVNPKKDELLKILSLSMNLQVTEEKNVISIDGTTCDKAE